MKAYFPAAVALLALAGCTTPVQKEQQQIAQTLSPCEKIDALMGAYNSNFQTLKRARIQSKFMDSWEATINLVGDSCQVTALDNTTTTYTCQESYKEKVDAVDIHLQAVDFTRQCLGTSWKEQQKESDSALRTTFVLDEKSPTVTVITGKSLSRKTPWTTSYKVGKSVE